MRRLYTEVNGNPQMGSTIPIANDVLEPGDLWMVPRTKEEMWVIAVVPGAALVDRAPDAEPVLDGDELLCCIQAQRDP